MLQINKVYLMDCFEFLKQIDDKSIDLIVTDPPYYIENLKKDLKETTIRESSRNNIFFNEFDHFENLDAFKLFVKSFLIEFDRVLKDKAQVLLFCSYHHLDWMIAMIKDLDFRFYKPLIWYKPDTMGVFPNNYGCNYEVILWFRKKGDDGKVKLHIGNGQRDVFKFNSTLQTYRKECGFHPTPKPIHLIRKFITNASDEGDLVLDCFMGSGTTAVASQQSHRNFIGSDNNKEYIAICEKRLSQKTLSFHDYGFGNDEIKEIGDEEDGTEDNTDDIEESDN